MWGRLWDNLRRGHVLVRLGLCLLAAIALWIITRGWAPPRTFYHGQVPDRNITARVQFEQVDLKATEEARERARTETIAIYDHDPSPLVQLRARLENEVSQILAAPDLKSVETLWTGFELPLAEGTPKPTPEENEQQFAQFREALSGEGAFEMFKTALSDASAPIMRHGLLDVLPPEDTNSATIAVRQAGSEGFESPVPVNDVLIESAAAQLQRSLEQAGPSLDVASRVFAWFRPKLVATLKLNRPATLEEQKKAVEDVPNEMIVYPVGTDLLIKAGLPLDDTKVQLLELEYQAELAAQPFRNKISRSLAMFGMYGALYTLCGFYIYRRDPRLIRDIKRLFVVLLMVVTSVGLMLLTSRDGWRAESVPLLVFAMTMAIAYQQELALLLCAAVTLISVVAMGLQLSDAVILLATTAGAILVLGQVRTRSKVLTVGFVAALVAYFTTIGIGSLEGQPPLFVVKSALLYVMWAVIAGSLMTCLLPAVERIFSVQTDLSLIELGDPAHPLLQELIRRAPGTYNHSITVASLAEAAAESIGARGLLVRVGAYFHDIGKMLKPGYFVENQGQGDNRHQSLVPAMSTLVIIAHVKDGVDLARQHKLPEPIIDFIQQHHGTTLIEYFYRQASDRREATDDKAVDETTFRYPGPKPQTKEAGILMLADAVESASRVLVEPTPARIESLVEELSRKRLLDGQFDECGLTIQEVSRIGDSLVKSLTAVYHGRVKYPDQVTA
jgi:hypothetical protein